MSTLNTAIRIAHRAHRGQPDKAGAPYIRHPLRVMERMKTEEEKIVAVLHDVIEDSRMSFEDLRAQGFSKRVLSALDCLTKRDGEEWKDFIDRVETNRLAVEVKIADLEDNMDLRRLPALTGKDISRLKKYHRAWLKLKEKMP